MTSDELGRVASIVHEKSLDSSVLAEYSWDYDELGRLVEEVDGDITKTYSYDETGQLTGVSVVDDMQQSIPSFDEEYDYDAGGNRDYDGVTGEVDVYNRLVDDGTWEYDYDAEGNLVKKTQGPDDETWKYTYDHRNQLTKAEEYDQDPDDEDEDAVLQMVVEYTYDIFGNRVAKQIDGDSPLSPSASQDGTVDFEEWYVIEGWNPAKPEPIGNENYDVWADLDENLDLKVHYVRGDQVDELLARVDSSGTEEWFLTDHLGSVRDIIENTSSATVVKSYDYDSFGNVIAESGSGDASRYQWTGREIDVETGLQYNRARYFDPALGRWLSQDPIGFEAGDSNLYRYVNNQPVMMTDPSGFVWSRPNRQQKIPFAHTVPGDPKKDTIATLATSWDVGLDVSDYKSWLTVTELAKGKSNIVDVKWQKGDENLSIKELVSKKRFSAKASFWVPNTVISYWGGEGNGVGRLAVGWDRAITNLKKRGFHIVEKGFKRIPLRIDPVDPLTANQLRQLLFDKTADKSLYGLYFWGHGVDFGNGKTFGYLTDGDTFGNLGKISSCFSFNKLPKKARDFVFSWDQISPTKTGAEGRLQYKLAGALMFMCFGIHGVDAVTSTNRTFIHGRTDILVPVGQIGKVEGALTRYLDNRIVVRFEKDDAELEMDLSCIRVPRMHGEA